MIIGVFPMTKPVTPTSPGGVGQALGPNTGVLFPEPQVEKIDILADKMPS